MDIALETDKVEMKYFIEKNPNFWAGFGTGHNLRPPEYQKIEHKMEDAPCCQKTEDRKVLDDQQSHESHQEQGRSGLEELPPEVLAGIACLLPLTSLAALEQVLLCTLCSF